MEVSVFQSVSPSGATALYRAAGSGGYDLARTLLEARANPNINNDEGASPLDSASRVSGRVCLEELYL